MGIDSPQPADIPEGKQGPKTFYALRGPDGYWSYSIGAVEDEFLRDWEEGSSGEYIVAKISGVSEEAARALEQYCAAVHKRTRVTTELLVQVLRGPAWGEYSAN